MSTAYHASFFAHELTKRAGSGSIARLASSLADAQVDLNPHQVEAALFALRSPLSKGAILADEVGLGKTIEAGILLAQMWAERKRKLLVIVPANLRKQWSQELADKFFLPSTILEAKSFNASLRGRNLNPFEQSGVVICSYQFARAKEPYVSQTSWDLVVLDEAHRLRNVYKTNSRIAQSIKASVAPYRKVLLTATPLQNSLQELFGLVSIVDEFLFGDIKSFRAQYARLGDDGQFDELKERLRPICKRTLRRQVSAYVKYTERKAVVQEFFPSDDEQRLYDLVSEYLQRPALYALPASQRMLMTLILRKLLASSTFAISGTLEGLADKLQDAAGRSERISSLPESLPENFEEIEEMSDEWAEDDDDTAESPKVAEKTYSAEDLIEVRKEVALLRDVATLAKSILKNSKGEVLLAALRQGFAVAEAAQRRGGASRLHQKAIIFTESRRTQDYRMGKHVDDINTFRVGHPLAQKIIAHCRDLRPETRHVRFDLSRSGRKIAILDSIAGQSGWLAMSRLRLDALEEEEHLLLAGLADNGASLEADQCRRFFNLPAGEDTAVTAIPGTVSQKLERMLADSQAALGEEMSQRHSVAFDDEMDKLDRWAEDKRSGLKRDLDELDSEIKELRKAARLAANLPEKLKLQRDLRNLETKRDDAWRHFDEAAREIEGKKDALLDEISQRLHQVSKTERLFILRWELV